MNNSLSRLALLLASAGLVCSCSMAPEYIRPDAPVDPAFPTDYPGAKDAPGARAAVDIGWTEFFRDERLKALIAAALENNRDLRIAAYRIEEARALYNIQWSERLPTVSVDADAVRTRNMSVLGRNNATSGNYYVGLGITAFELDFFGRVKSLSDAALAQYLATEHAKRAAYLSLIAEVAKCYFTERAQTRQIELATESYDSFKKSYDLIKKRYDVGASSALELREYETLMQGALVTLSSLKRQRAQTMNALVVLIGGKTLANLPPEKPFSDDAVMQEISAGLPSDLLANRPDIAQYEQLLISANANIGAARAAFFPRISLTVFGGTISPKLSNLFDPHTAAWRFAPSLTMPIFDAGNNIANLDLAYARKNIAVAQYEKTIQVAFREVADALSARGWLNEQVSAQTRLVEAEAERLKLSQARHDAGIANLLQLHDALRMKFAADQKLVDARLLRLINQVELYRALGGGLLSKPRTVGAAVTAPVAKAAATETTATP